MSKEKLDIGAVSGFRFVFYASDLEDMRLETIA